MRERPDAPWLGTATSRQFVMTDCPPARMMITGMGRQVVGRLVRAEVASPKPCPPPARSTVLAESARLHPEPKACHLNAVPAPPNVRSSVQFQTLGDCCVGHVFWHGGCTDFFEDWFGFALKARMRLGNPKQIQLGRPSRVQYRTRQCRHGRDCSFAACSTKTRGWFRRSGKCARQHPGLRHLIPCQSLNAGARHIEAPGELALAHVERDQELVFQYLTRMARVRNRWHLQKSLFAVCRSS